MNMTPLSDMSIQEKVDITSEVVHVHLYQPNNAPYQ